jgi:hypothetical protein
MELPLDVFNQLAIVINYESETAEKEKESYKSIRRN